MVKLAVVGDIALDYLWNARTSVMDRSLEDAILVDQIDFNNPVYGDRGGNVAFYARLFGADEVNILAAIGKRDGTGKMREYLGHLEGIGISLGGSVIYPDWPPMGVVMIRDSSGVGVPVVGDGIVEENVDGLVEKHTAFIGDGNISLDAVFCTSGNKKINSSVALAAAKREIYVAFMPATQTWSYSKKDFDEIIPFTNLLFLNAGEYGHFVEKASDGDPIEWLDIYPKLKIVCTNGSSGCTILSRDLYEEIPGKLVDKVIDATGAGDSLAAVTLVEYLRNGGDIVKAARRGNKVASEVVRHMGSQVKLDSLKF